MRSFSVLLLSALVLAMATTSAVARPREADGALLDSPAAPLMRRQTVIIDNRPTDPFFAAVNGFVSTTSQAPALGGLSTNSFYAGEVFAMYNMHKKTCLSAKPHGARKRLRLVTERCSAEQAWTADSRMAFHWHPISDNNLVNLAIYYEGVELCARHTGSGTRFYACDHKSTTYTLGATKKNGTFKIRANSLCMDAEYQSALRMKLCGSFRDQGWQKFHISFMQ